MATDGLAALDRKRTEAAATRRRLPPPRHAKAGHDSPVPSGADTQDPPAAEAAQGGTAHQSASPLPASPAPLTVPATPPPAPATGSPPPQTHRRSRVRATQVHLDEISEEHLNNLRKRSVMAEVDLTNSAVLRLALAELVERHGYDQIVEMFAQDEGRLRRGRPRS